MVEPRSNLEWKLWFSSHLDSALRDRSPTKLATINMCRRVVYRGARPRMTRRNKQANLTPRSGLSARFRSSSYCLGLFLQPSEKQPQAVTLSNIHRNHTVVSAPQTVAGIARPRYENSKQSIAAAADCVMWTASNSRLTATQSTSPEAVRFADANSHHVNADVMRIIRCGRDVSNHRLQPSTSTPVATQYVPHAPGVAGSQGDV